MFLYKLHEWVSSRLVRLFSSSQYIDSFVNIIKWYNPPKKKHTKAGHCRPNFYVAHLEKDYLEKSVLNEFSKGFTPTIIFANSLAKDDGLLKPYNLRIKIDKHIAKQNGQPTEDQRS
jgi:hypothetical protein